MESPYHTGFMKKSVKIQAPQNKVWRKISNIVGLPSWVVGAKKTVFLSKKKRGVGAVRKITLDDGTNIEEHIVGWRNGQYFSYIAISGLPLRAYHATISIKPISKNNVSVIWQSYFNSQKMTKKEFDEFVAYLGSFYLDSLKNLKSGLEK